jgi:hypothetical protein
VIDRGLFHQCQIVLKLMNRPISRHPEASVSGKEVTS